MLQDGVGVVWFLQHDIVRGFRSVGHGTSTFLGSARAEPKESIAHSFSPRSGN
jgi:hypothetical protein